MYIKIFQAFPRAFLQCETKVCKPIHDVFIYISISWDNKRQILNTLTSSLTAEHGTLLEEKKSNHRGSPFGIQNHSCFILGFIEYILVKVVIAEQENLDPQNQYIVT